MFLCVCMCVSVSTCSHLALAALSPGGLGRTLLTGDELWTLKAVIPSCPVLLSLPCPTYLLFLPLLTLSSFLFCPS